MKQADQIEKNVNFVLGDILNIPVEESESFNVDFPPNDNDW
jgi:hypothetical protein